MVLRTFWYLKIGIFFINYKIGDKNWFVNKNNCKKNFFWPRYQLSFFSS